MSETGPSVSVAQVDTVLALGRRMHIAGGFAVAERAYRQVLEASPDHPEALRCMGQLAFQTGRGAEALEFLNRSVAARPGDSATRCDLSRVCLGLGMASEAAAHARVALAFSPALFEAHATLADALRQGGRWEEAIGHYLEILRSAPEEVGALLGLGFCLLSVDRNEEAEAVIATAERLAPELPEALHLRGVVRHRMGKPEEALPWLMRARALDPANARIAVSLAMAQDGCTRCEDALATLRLVEEGNGNDPEFLSAVCHVLIGLNRLDEAEDYGRRALALDPNSANACNSMGRICDALWRLEEAEAFFRRVLELRNGSGLELTNLSKVLLAQGRMEESMLLAERAYELYPKHIRVQFNLAMRLLRSGDLTRGWEMYEVSKAKGGARVPSWDVDLPDLEVDGGPRGHDGSCPRRAGYRRYHPVSVGSSGPHRPGQALHHRGCPQDQSVAETVLSHRDGRHHGRTVRDEGPGARRPADAGGVAVPPLPHVPGRLSQSPPVFHSRSGAGREFPAAAGGGGPSGPGLAWAVEVR
ncbi:MAG: tetratricopeptide repeat protein [Alphaproteobacteria bacterium]|nr:tetratricopeptide repeat protein [Alphaproteobacteria bacterium]